PIELIEFIARMRELSGGKPAGFKLCVGSRTDVLAICKAMLEVGTAPDFIIVDGSEGGSGAAPLEYEDHVGAPLTDGLLTVHNALVGTGLRDRIRIGASGKIAAGNDVVKRLVQGADYTNSARAMLMAVGCIQAQICHTGLCPVGVTTQDPKRQRALHVGDKSVRVKNYQEATVKQAVEIMASMGVSDPRDLTPELLQRNIERSEHRSYAELYEWLEPGELVSQPPESWMRDRSAADPASSRPRLAHRIRWPRDSRLAEGAGCCLAEGAGGSRDPADEIARVMLPVLDGAQAGIEVSDRLVSEVEDVRVEVRRMRVGLLGTGHDPPDGRAHLGGVVDVLDRLPAADPVRVAGAVSGGEDVGLRGSQRFVDDDPVVRIQAGGLGQSGLRFDAETDDHGVEVIGAGVEVEHHAIAVDAASRGLRPRHESHPVAAVELVEGLGEVRWEDGAAEGVVVEDESRSGLVLHQGGGE